MYELITPSYTHERAIRHRTGREGATTHDYQRVIRDARGSHSVPHCTPGTVVTSTFHALVDGTTEKTGLVSSAASTIHHPPFLFLIFPPPGAWYWTDGVPPVPGATVSPTATQIASSALPAANGLVVCQEAVGRPFLGLLWPRCRR